MAVVWLMLVLAPALAHRLPLGTLPWSSPREDQTRPATARA